MAARLSLFIVLASGWCTSALAEEQGDNQLVRYSLQVDVDDEARAQLAASEAELARGDLVTAVARWRSMLDSDRPGRLVPYAGAFTSVPAAVAALVRSQPPAVLDEYLRITEPSASRVLAQALADDDPAALWSISDRFPLTPSAQSACEYLAERLFDAGAYSECRLAVDRWFDQADDQQLLVARRPEMVAWRRLSLLALGDHNSANARWAEFADDLPAGLRQLVTRTEFALGVAGDRASRPSVSSVSEVTEVLPSGEVLWSSRTSPSFPREWSAKQADFEELVHPLFMVARPVATSRGLLVPGNVHRLLDPGTGQAVWSLNEPPAAPDNSLGDVLESLRTALGESIRARPSVLGGRILTVAPLRKNLPVVPYANELNVSALESGALQQSLRSFADPGGQPTTSTVLGPPTAGHSQVYVVLQTAEELSIAALDFSLSEPRWRTRLGDAGLELMLDSRRRWMPALVDVSGDSVLCATGNGAVASLDPRSGRLQWVSRSAREDWRDAGLPRLAAVTNLPRQRMWMGWREPVIRRIGDVVIWAGPESDSITGLDRRTGQVLWSRPRDDGLAVMIADSTVLIIEADEIRRVNPLDGTIRWATAISPPAGAGFVAGNWYVQPLRSGGSVALELENGAPTRGVSWDSEVLPRPLRPLDQLRSFTWTPSGILVQSPLGISLHRTLAATSAASSTPQWLAAAGRLAEAKTLPEDAAAQGSNWRARLRLVAQENTPGEFHLVDAPYERLPRPAADRTAKNETAENETAKNELVGFLADRRSETALALLERAPLAELSSLWVESNRSPALRVRADVLAANAILSHPAGELPSGLLPIPAALRARLEELLKRVATSRPEDVSRLLDLFAHSEWGAGRLLDGIDGAANSFDARDMARRRLKLLTLIQLGGDVGARAANIKATLRPTPRPVAAWPERAPVLNPPRAWNSRVDQWSSAFKRSGGVEHSCLSVDLKLTGFSKQSGGGAVFSGCGQDRPWEIDLPKTDRSFGQSADYRQAFGIGPLVMLQAGTGLHGLLPFDAAGHRTASRLWDVAWIDMWGDVSSHSVSFLPRHADATPGRPPLNVDDFERPLTQLGPVNTLCFCYREFGRLVCCETSTGRRMWDRAPLDPDAIVAGDASAIVVHSPSRTQVDVFNPHDGSLIASRPMDLSDAHWRTAIQSTAILRRGALSDTPRDTKPAPQSSDLTAVELKTGEKLWSRPVDPAAVDFMVGDRLAGVANRTSIELFDPQTNAERARITIDAAEVSEVYAVDDPFALMIGVFGPPAVVQLRPPVMFAGNRRRPSANGTLYGLDPETLELKWTIPLEGTVFSLDQPKDLPLLIINDIVASRMPTDPEAREDRIRCFDKRTGRKIGPDLSGEGVGPNGIVIERSQAEGWIDVRTSKAIFRFDFTGAR